MSELNGYELSRNWFDWCFENPEKISPNHTAIYFFAIEHCNRLGWKEKFGFPTQMAMDALGIKKHNTYIKYFRDLCEWGFFNIIQESKNQYSANIISLSNALPKNGKALDKAFIKHGTKQTESNGQSNSSIDKQVTIEQKNNRTKKQVAPTVDMVKLYFAENGYSEYSAVTAFNFYNSADWHDSNGKKVKNWKQKMQGVWFKEENKIKATIATRIKTDADVY